MKTIVNYNNFFFLTYFTLRISCMSSVFASFIPFPHPSNSFHIHTRRRSLNVVTSSLTIVVVGVCVYMYVCTYVHTYIHVSTTCRVHLEELSNREIRNFRLGYLGQESGLEKGLGCFTNCHSVFSCRTKESPLCREEKSRRES